MLLNTGEVAGKTVVITGASSGLGRGVALALAASGARVVVAARRGDVLDDLVDEIHAAGGIALAVVVDVSVVDQVHELARAAVESFGGFDVWINNVGIGALGLFWEVPVEDHARVIEVNLIGLLSGAHAAMLHFIQRGAGVLLNIGSVEGRVPLALQSSYAASKAGVLSLSRTIHEDLRISDAPAEIRVGTILPWALDTPWWDHAANYTGRAPRMAAMEDPGTVIEAIVAACVDPGLEQPVGWKARAAEASHRFSHGLTEHASARIAQQESRRGAASLPTQGSIHRPTAAGVTVRGGIRERMSAEDDAS